MERIKAITDKEFIEMKSAVIEAVETLDSRVNRTMEKNRFPLLYQGLDSITALGSVYVNLVILTLLWSFGQTFLANQLAAGLAATWIALYSMKYIVKRQRPENHIEHVLSRASFPSGHSGTAFLTAGILSTYLGHGIIFFSLAFLVGFSRVYLEDHYFSDAVVGSGIGFLIAQILITV